MATPRLVSVTGGKLATCRTRAVAGAAAARHTRLVAQAAVGVTKAAAETAMTAARRTLTAAAAAVAAGTTAATTEVGDRFDRQLKGLGARVLRRPRLPPLFCSLPRRFKLVLPHVAILLFAVIYEGAPLSSSAFGYFAVPAVRSTACESTNIAPSP